MTSDVEWDTSQCDKDLDDYVAFYLPSEEYYEEQHYTVTSHYTCYDEEFYDACELFDYEDQVDDLRDTVHPENVSDIYGVNSSEISKATPNFFVPILVGPLLITSKPHLVLQLSVHEDEFPTPLNSTGVPGSPLAM
jgi:hypothetical protein